MNGCNADIVSSLREIQREMRDEYLQPHQKPWIVGFSGGKDSTLLAKLTLECILSAAPDERHRKTYIIYNDTLVESPVFQEFAKRTLQMISDGIAAHQIPAEVVQTEPEAGETFWINLLGKGYPAPNNFFRWCMDRLKIQPTAKFIGQRVSEFGEAILLLGIRRAESLTRARRIDKYSEMNNYERLSPHNDIPGCWIYKPIMNLSTDDVWSILESFPPPWGGKTTQTLFDIYRNAGLCNATQGCALANELAIGESRTMLARFGCWTCTVVERDKSLEAMIEAGYTNLKPLAAFRERIRDVSNDPNSRSKTRRNGRPGLGPLTLDARKMLLEELLNAQNDADIPLISDQEIRQIREQWSRDECESAIRNAREMAQAK